MIDYRRRGDFFVFQALHAQRVALEIQLSCLAPPGTVDAATIRFQDILKIESENYVFDQAWEAAVTGYKLT